jgi:hypothetical protein
MKKKNKKQKLDEGMILMSPMLAVGGLVGMPPKRKDNFVFKGLPGQFNENGDKIFDEFGDPLKEEKITEDSYHSNAIDDFIKKNEKEMGEYYPTLKVFGNNGDTKHLNVSFDALREISKVLKKMKV